MIGQTLWQTTTTAPNEVIQTWMSSQPELSKVLRLPDALSSLSNTSSVQEAIGVLGDTLVRAATKNAQPYAQEMVEQWLRNLTGSTDYYPAGNITTALDIAFVQKTLEDAYANATRLSAATVKLSQLPQVRKLKVVGELASCRYDNDDLPLFVIMLFLIHQPFHNSLSSLTLPT